MGRTLPMEEITTFQPTTSVILTIIWMAALVTTISGLCGLWSKKITKSPSTKENDETKEGDENPNPLQPPTVVEQGTSEDDQFATKPLPPPPSAVNLELGDIATGKMKPKIDKTSSLQNYMSKNTSRKRLTSSISMRMSMKLKDKASEFKGKASEFKDKASDLTDLRKNKNENESLWQKRIILGEKCRLPNQDDEGVAYDGQGNNVVTQTQTRKLPSMSRSCSSIDHRALSSIAISEEKGDDKRKGKEKVEDFDDDDV
ncbi:hypothetical protein RND81_10G172800 [Saponaria officinalis]|uniref:Uncharacterized protein n=1 Tax=Saponaria officinalis TaxID=3572 RepID=A0AAW1I4S9_SAPOF